jgi:hypothetical protein
MNSTKARDLASDWVAEHDESERNAARDLYSWFAKEIEGLLSENVFAGAAVVENQPAVIAVEGQRLCWLALAKGDDGELLTKFGSLPLQGVLIEVEGLQKAMGPGIQRNWTWRLQSGSRSVLISTKEFRRAPAGREVLGSGESVLREAAKRSGQPFSAIAV